MHLQSFFTCVCKNFQFVLHMPYVCYSVCLSVCLLACLSVCKFVCMYIECLNVSQYVCMLVFLFEYMFVSLYVSLFICLYVCLIVEKILFDGKCFLLCKHGINNCLEYERGGRSFLVAKLLYKSKCPSVCIYECLSVRFRGKRDFLGP